MKRYCLTLDLKDDPELIAAYEEHHRRVWPEVLASIRHSGIVAMEIYRVATRLCMIVDAEDYHSFEKSAKDNATNTKVQAWEALMDNYQQRLPFARPDQKWVLMEKIFEL